MAASTDWSRYELLPGFVLGFHGCDRAIGEAVLSGRLRHITYSANAYDWLGHGIYFWEYSPERAMTFAREAKASPNLSRGRIKEPFVVGAIIDPGHCLNLLDAAALEQVKDAYELLVSSSAADGRPLPENEAVAGRGDLPLRYLDCAIVEMLHAYREKAEIGAFDTVRGAFWEGYPLYPNAGFRARNHVQICVRNPECIKGYFRPIRSA